jgi:hypothetical protein
LDESEIRGSLAHAMTDSSQLGYYSVSFPPDGQHALLTNQGPGVPHTSLIALTEGGLDHFSRLRWPRLPNHLPKVQGGLSIIPCLTELHCGDSRWPWDRIQRWRRAVYRAGPPRLL